MRDQSLRFLERTFLLWQSRTGDGVLFALAGRCGIFGPAISLLLWGQFARLVVHAARDLGSEFGNANIWGYRTYPTRGITAANLWWVGWLAFGEGWHNNHHAFPRVAQQRAPLVGIGRDVLGDRA